MGGWVSPACTSLARRPGRAGSLPLPPGAQCLGRQPPHPQPRLMTSAATQARTPPAASAPLRPSRRAPTPPLRGSSAPTAASLAPLRAAWAPLMRVSELGCWGRKAHEQQQHQVSAGPAPEQAWLAGASWQLRGAPLARSRRLGLSPPRSGGVGLSSSSRPPAALQARPPPPVSPPPRAGAWVRPRRTAPAVGARLWPAACCRRAAPTAWWPGRRASPASA